MDIAIDDFNLDDFPQLLSQTTSLHPQGITPYSGYNSPSNFYQHSDMVETGSEVAPSELSGKDLFSCDNPRYKAVENLPWFQLQELVNEPGRSLSHL